MLCTALLYYNSKLITTAYYGLQWMYVLPDGLVRVNIF